MKYTGRTGWVASYKDTFSLDYTLSPIIYAALVKFKEQSDKAMFGVPWPIIKDIFGNREDGQYTDEELQTAHDAWITIIDKMIFAFHPDVLESAPLDDIAYWDKVNEGHTLFGKYYRNLWW